MLNNKAKNSNLGIDKDDEFQLDLKIPEVGEFKIKIRQEILEKTYRAIQKLLPWLLSFSIGGGVAFINGNMNHNQPVDYNSQSQVK